MDVNNKQSRTDVNKTASDKIPHDEQKLKTAAAFEKAGGKHDGKNTVRQPGQATGNNTSQHHNTNE